MGEHLDPELLAELEVIMEEEFPTLLETFLADAQKHYQQIGSTWRNDDLDGLRRSAHSLKGSSANIGAGALAELCSTLEAQAHARETGSTEACIRLLSRELEAVCAEIRTRLTAA
ncbi:MAG: Hpt domain-containing protein [Pseudomonadales bacterium]|nr:Hpt domain-containing protein [Pseudomonadales bacterium]